MKTRIISFRQEFGLLAAVATIGCLTAFGQPTSFTYQGRLNSGLSSANGLYDLTFSLFASSSGGSALAGPVTNSTVISNGLFTVVLDFGAGAFPGADRWLEIAVRTNGPGPFTNLAPRQLITSTPYALRAANVANGAIARPRLQMAQSRRANLRLARFHS